MDRFSESFQISNFMQIRSVGVDLFHADGQTDRHDEVSFHNFAKEPKNAIFFPVCKTGTAIMYTPAVRRANDT
jgi:hypothetical protein